jgi:glycosyltransferase involved in cell wall biosynthesis
MNQNSEVAYVVVTPVRDEGRTIAQTIESFAAQTIRPRRWIIVNDGSSDDTGRIADAAAAKHPWITVVHRPNRGFRKTGGGVIEAFYAGYELVRHDEWDFIGKFDADLSFDPDFFKSCFERFTADPKLGIGGGTVWEFREGRWTVGSPGDPAFHVRGATKLYRRACWEQIGGLIQELGWDTVDELKANMLGWRTCTFGDLKLCHYKLTGSADGRWKHLIKAGRANYVTGYHPLFMVVKCLKRWQQKPYFIAPLGLAVGFFSGYAVRAPRITDERLVRWVRRQQINCLRFRTSLWAGNRLDG